MLNENLPISGGSVVALPYPTLHEMPSIDNPLPLKFVYYRQTSPHEKLIAQAFYHQAINYARDWQKTAEAVCYRYGIGGDYLDNCLSKVRVFNPNQACVYCGVLYQIVDPTSGITAASNMFADKAGDNVSNHHHFQKNSMHQPATESWFCGDCKKFMQYGCSLEDIDDGVSF